MTTITIENAGKYDGQEVTIRGWLYNIRESGKLVFPIFRTALASFRASALSRKIRGFRSA